METTAWQGSAGGASAHINWVGPGRDREEKCCLLLHYYHLILGGMNCLLSTKHQENKDSIVQLDCHRMSQHKSYAIFIVEYSAYLVAYGLRN